MALTGHGGLEQDEIGCRVDRLEEGHTQLKKVIDVYTDLYKRQFVMSDEEFEKFKYKENNMETIIKCPECQAKYLSVQAGVCPYCEIFKRNDHIHELNDVIVNLQKENGNLHGSEVYRNSDTRSTAFVYLQEEHSKLAHTAKKQHEELVRIAEFANDMGDFEIRDDDTIYLKHIKFAYDVQRRMVCSLGKRLAVFEKTDMADVPYFKVYTTVKLAMHKGSRVGYIIVDEKFPESAVGQKYEVTFSPIKEAE